MKKREEQTGAVIVPSFSLTTSRLSLFNTLAKTTKDTKTGEVKISQFPTAQIGDWFEAHFYGLNASGFRTDTFAIKFQLQ